MYPCHALSKPVFCYFLLLNVCDIIDMENFFLEPKGGGGKAAQASFTVNTQRFGP